MTSERLYRDLHVCFDGTDLTTTQVDQVLWKIYAAFEHDGVPLTEICDGDIELGDDLKLHLRNNRLMVETAHSFAP